MKKIISLVVPGMLLLLLNSCATSDAMKSSPYGSYIYRSYNFLGDLVGEGTLYVNESDGETFSGNWQIREVRLCDNCGAQFGYGYLTGYIENDTMIVNLNPDINDIDTKLIGVIANGDFTGDWRWHNQAGFGYYGSFEAIKQ